MRFLLAALAALALPLAAAAQEEAELSDELEAAVAAAQERGLELYRYDQAAWHATDSFQEDFDMSNASYMRGYIVLPREDGLLDTVFFGEVDGTLVEVARYTVDGSTVVEGEVLAESARPPLSPLAIRLAAARQSAFQYASEQKFQLCARSNPNTVVLPPDDAGTISVYLFTPPTTNDSYPLGGHFRVEIDPDGKAVSSRRFLNSCFALQRPAGRDDSTVALVVSHLLDPQPTEIHFFASLYFPLPIYVATTDNDLLWDVTRGRLVSVSDTGN